MFRGTIILQDSLRVKLQTAVVNRFSFLTQLTLLKQKSNVLWKLRGRSQGICALHRMEPLVAGKTTIDGVTTAAFSFQTVNGYRFNQYLFTGAGIGIDLYATQTMLPVFGSIGGDLSITGSLIPFYYVDGGYAVNITQNFRHQQRFPGRPVVRRWPWSKIPFNKSAGSW